MVLNQLKNTLALLLLIILMVVGLIVSDHLVITADGNISHPDAMSSRETNSQLSRAFLPMLKKDRFSFGPTLAPPIGHTGAPPLDIDAIQANFKAKGHDLAFSKIGFHLGPGGNPTGYVDWLAALDSAGIPFFVKSVDDAGRLDEAVALAKASNVPHTIVYRRSGGEYELPDYNKTPAAAAVEHWERHIANFVSTNLDRKYVWLETINEVDKSRSEWLGDFALETAELALRDDYKWAAFGWSSGEPEPEHWESPSMLAFLRLASQHPDQLAIALHEYSLDDNDLGRLYPWLVGRLQKLFEVCDKHGIPRPTVLITEFGWTYNDLPTVNQAMEQIEWAAWLYSAYPTVRGAAIWYLGGWFNIENQTQALIAPVTDYSLANYFEYVPGTGDINTNLFNPPPWLIPDQRPRPGVSSAEAIRPSFVSPVESN